MAQPGRRTRPLPELGHERARCASRSSQSGDVHDARDGAPTAVRAGSAASSSPSCPAGVSTAMSTGGPSTACSPPRRLVRPRDSRRAGRSHATIVADRTPRDRSPESGATLVRGDAGVPAPPAVRVGLQSMRLDLECIARSRPREGDDVRCLDSSDQAPTRASSAFETPRCPRPSSSSLRNLRTTAPSRLAEPCDRARRGLGRAAVRRLLGPRAAPHPAHHGARRLLPVAGDGARGRSSGATRLAARERHRPRARNRAGVLGGVPRRRRIDRRRASRRPDRPRARATCATSSGSSTTTSASSSTPTPSCATSSKGTAGSAATTVRSCRTPPRWRSPSDAVSSTSSPC